jgi:hypothetical protein
MFDKMSTVLVMLAIPALADSGLFHEIRRKDAITLVLPSGECDAKVVSRILDQLTLRLKRKTGACGERKSLITLSRIDVRNVVNNKLRTAHYPGESPGGFCAAIAMALVGAPASYAIGAKTRNGPLSLLVLFGSGVGGAALCRQRGTHYTVFTDRIVPAQP